MERLLRCGAVLTGLFFLGGAAAQDIRILSPPSGTVVHPGDSLTISVLVPPGTILPWIFSTAPLPDVSPGPSANTFVLKIPLEAPLQSYQLTAMGKLGEDVISSEPVELHLEAVQIPAAIVIEPAIVKFRAPGERMPLMVSAEMPGARRADLTHSTYMRFETSNGRVAAVDASGIVVAVGKGRALVRATYTYGNVSRAVVVEVP